MELIFFPYNNNNNNKKNNTHTQNPEGFSHLLSSDVLPTKVHKLTRAREYY